MEITQKAVQQLIREFTGQANTITTPRVFVELTGNHVAAMLLNQIIYWSERTHNNEGWFYKSAKEWEEELGLSSFQVNRALKILLPLGVETKLKRANNAPTVHYRLNGDSFYPLFFKFLENRETRKSRNSKMDIEVSSKSDFRETQKTLTETTRDYITETNMNAAADAQPAATEPKLKVVDPWEKPPREKKSPLKAVPKPKPEADATMQNEMVKLYCDIIRLTPDVALRKEIAARITDKGRWAEVLKDWLGHPNWNKWNVMGQIDRYNRWEELTSVSRTGTNGRPTLAANGIRPSSFGSGPGGRYTREDLDDDIGAAKYRKNRPAITGYAQS